MTHVSMYRITKEILEEERTADAFKISDKSSEYSKHFKKILRGLMVNPDIFKNKKGNYEIPVKAKEEVKKLLKSKETLPIRNGEFGNASLTNLQETINSIKTLLECKLSGNDLQRELEQLEVITQFSIRQSIHSIEIGGIQNVTNDINRMLSVDFEQVLSQDDRAVILDFYEEELESLYLKLRRIIQIISDLREVELNHVTEEEESSSCDELADGRQKIDEMVITEVLKEKQEQKILCEHMGIQSINVLVEELKDLQSNKEGTENFIFVTNKERDSKKQYRSSEDVLKEAASIFHEEQKEM